MEIEQLDSFKTFPAGDSCCTVPPGKLTDNRPEKRNMRGVVQIYPDIIFWGATVLIHTSFPNPDKPGPKLTANTNKKQRRFNLELRN